MGQRPTSKTVQARRRARLQSCLETEFGGSKSALAGWLGKSQSQLSRFMHFTKDPRHHQGIGEDLARDIEEKLQKPVGWLDGKDGPDATPAPARTKWPFAIDIGKFDALTEEQKALVERTITVMISGFQTNGAQTAPFAGDHRSTAGGKRRGH